MPRRPPGTRLLPGTVGCLREMLVASRSWGVTRGLRCLLSAVSRKLGPTTSMNLGATSSNPGAAVRKTPWWLPPETQSRGYRWVWPGRLMCEIVRLHVAVAEIWWFVMLQWKWNWKSFSHVRLCASIDYTVPGILQARILEWVAFPFSRGFSQPRDRIQVSHIEGGFFTSWATGEAQEYWSG